MEKYYIKGGSVYMDGRFCDRTIAMEDGHIFVLPKDFEPGGDAQVYDASGCHVVPGFIDVHTHGAVGVDVNAASAEDLEKNLPVYGREWYYFLALFRADRHKGTDTGMYRCL